MTIPLDLRRLLAPGSCWPNCVGALPQQTAWLAMRDALAYCPPGVPWPHLLPYAGTWPAWVLIRQRKGL